MSAFGCKGACPLSLKDSPNGWVDVAGGSLATREAFKSLEMSFQIENAVRQLSDQPTILVALALPDDEPQHGCAKDEKEEEIHREVS